MTCPSCTVFAIAAFVLSLIAAPLAMAEPGDLEGLWRGNLEHVRPDGDPVDLYFGLTVEVGENGDISATVSAYQIALSAAAENLQDESGVVSFAFDLSGDTASFEGTRDGDSLSGTVTVSGQTRAAALERLFTDLDSDVASSRVGTYEFDDGGTLVVGPYSWALAVHDLQTGAYRVYFPRSTTEYTAGPVSLIPAPVESRISFVEENGVVALRREQDGEVRTAHRSTRVAEEEIEFSNGDVTLRGLFVRPAETSAPIPGVVVAWGSGQQNRFGFDALTYYRAVWLAEHGIAVVIWDKRGIGNSTGSYDDRTMEQLAGDMSAAIDFLAAQPGVDGSRVGLLVHSQSGIYGPLTLEENDTAAFMGVIGATVLNGEIQEIVRTEQQLRADGWPEEDAQAAAELQRRKFHYASTREGWDEYIEAYDQLVDRPWFEEIVGSSNDPEHPAWDFWRDGNGFEPADHWRNVEVPVHYFVGRLDMISPVDGSIEALEGAFAGERAGLLTVTVYPGSEHSLFETETGGSLEEVSRAQMLPYMDDFMAWLTQIHILE